VIKFDSSAYLTYYSIFSKSSKLLLFDIGNGRFMLILGDEAFLTFPTF